MPERLLPDIEALLLDEISSTGEGSMSLLTGVNEGGKYRISCVIIVTVHAKRWDKSAKELALDYENLRSKFEADSHLSC